jgi:hypothetical protein
MCAQFKSCTSPLTRLGFKPQSHSKSPLKEDWGRFTVHFSRLDTELLLLVEFNEPLQALQDALGKRKRELYL